MIDKSEVFYDVCVIGAGVVGSAIARELARYDLACALIEAGPDIGVGTSKANTAILHTGFDAKQGYLENQLVRRGYKLLNDYGSQVGIPIERNGAILVAWDESQKEALPAIRENAHNNGVLDVEYVSLEELYRREPYLGEGALAALEVPGESTICTFTTTLAYASQAVSNNVDLYLNLPVNNVLALEDGGYALKNGCETIYCYWVVNAAGLNSDIINEMFGHEEFTVIPRRGELIVFDKLAGELVDHIFLPVPGKMGKGVLISPTIYGNVMLGPTAEDLDDKTAKETSSAGLAMLWEKGKRIVPNLLKEEITATYAGLRASTEHDDYQIALHPEQHYLCVGGIRSTGLTASMAIAEYAVEKLVEGGLELRSKPDFKDIQMPNIGENGLRPFQLAEMIKNHPDYGALMCHCERVSKGEILDTLQSPIPPANFDGLRRRTRALMGRCQGFYCFANIAALMAEQGNWDINRLTGLQEGEK